MDRNCEICKHHSESGCSKWECQFEPTDSKHEVIEELEKVREEIENDQEQMANEKDFGKYYGMGWTIRIIDKHIAELKGEQ